MQMIPRLALIWDHLLGGHVLIRTGTTQLVDPFAWVGAKAQKHT